MAKQGTFAQPTNRQAHAIGGPTVPFRGLPSIGLVHEGPRQRHVSNDALKWILV
jgi:hypothetical protein